MDGTLKTEGKEGKNLMMPIVVEISWMVLWFLIPFGITLLLVGAEGFYSKDKMTPLGMVIWTLIGTGGSILIWIITSGIAAFDAEGKQQRSNQMHTLPHEWREFVEFAQQDFNDSETAMKMAIPAFLKTNPPKITIKQYDFICGQVKLLPEYAGKITPFIEVDFTKNHVEDTNIIEEDKLLERTLQRLARNVTSPRSPRYADTTSLESLIPKGIVYSEQRHGDEESLIPKHQHQGLDRLPRAKEQCLFHLIKGAEEDGFVLRNWNCRSRCVHHPRVTGEVEWRVGVEP